MSGTVGEAILSSDNFVANGFARAVAYKVSPALPAGLRVNGSTGSVSGTPSAAQPATTYTVTATDGLSSAQATISISIADSTKPVVLPVLQRVHAFAGSAITPTEALATSGFSKRPTFSVSPPLPRGLALSSFTGTVSGTPDLAQKAFGYVITADDGTDTATTDVTITIDPIMTPLVQTLNIQTDVPMTPSEPLVPLGLQTPVAFGVVPPLPAGLDLDVLTGVISGTPAQMLPQASFTITASDGQVTADARANITVSCWDQTATPGTCIPAPLKLGGVSAAQSLVVTAGAQPFHKQLDPTSTDNCAACHRTHTDQSKTFVPVAQSVSQQCLTCHNSTGAATNYNVQAEYTGATANNPATRSFYTHDAVTTDPATLAANPHYTATLGDSDQTVPSTEFAAETPAPADPNRHAQCTDCHNPHFSSSTTQSTHSTSGWSASTFINGASGVSVDNSKTGAARYALLGSPTTRITLEYQLCFKCHSGYTNLPSNTGFTPETWYLDKAVEFDTTSPANSSFHPIEGAGRNTSGKMTDSLAGASDYKLWTFTVGQTVRCANCHASGGRTAAGGAGQVSPPHVSLNRSILILPYKDRALNATGSFVEGNYALCFACHTDAPFKSETSTGTNFQYHYKHMAAISGSGNGINTTDINTPNAGRGNAICAECHYRSHSTTTELSVGTQSSAQTLSGRGLVSFSPNVVGSGTGAKPTFNSNTPGSGTCTLVCHGYTHDGKGY